MENTKQSMNEVLTLQKNYFIKHGSPSIELRVDRLNRLKTMIMENKHDFVDALNSDYGNRSKDASLMTDAYSIVPDISSRMIGAVQDHLTLGLSWHSSGNGQPHSSNSASPINVIAPLPADVVS